MKKSKEQKADLLNRKKQIQQSFHNQHVLGNRSKKICQSNPYMIQNKHSQCMLNSNKNEFSVYKQIINNSNCSKDKQKLNRKIVHHCQSSQSIHPDTATDRKQVYIQKNKAYYKKQSQRLKAKLLYYQSKQNLSISSNKQNQETQEIKNKFINSCRQLTSSITNKKNPKLKFCWRFFKKMVEHFLKNQKLRDCKSQQESSKLTQQTEHKQKQKQVLKYLQQILKQNRPKSVRQNTLR